MPVRGGNKVRASFKRAAGEIRNVKTERVITKIMIEGLANAAVITPVDTANLINSQFRRIVQTQQVILELLDILQIMRHSLTIQE